MGKRAIMLGMMLGLGWLAPPARSQGVTVQLPTYRTFRVATTVSVPDRGGMYLGGVNGARSSRPRFGSPLTRGGVALGSDRQAAGMHVSAYIHDQQQMDRQLLGDSTGQVVSSERRFPLVAGNRSDGALRSVAESRASQQVASEARQDEAEACYERGRDAAAAGKTGVARIHLQMAARRATGELKQRILAELQRLDVPVAAKIDR